MIPGLGRHAEKLKFSQELWLGESECVSMEMKFSSESRLSNNCLGVEFHLAFLGK